MPPDEKIRWRFPQRPLPASLGLPPGVLAVSDIAMPSGKRFLVGIASTATNVAGARRSLDRAVTAVPDLMGAILDLPDLLGAALDRAMSSGSAGRQNTTTASWNIDVVRRETRWRGARVVYSETFNDVGSVADRAQDIAEHIAAGRGQLHW